MKNREKYRDEILNSVFRGNGDEYCKFVKKNVLPNLTDCTNWECGELHACGLCRDIFAFWLDEEYEEPPKPEVDWSKVPVDTLVRVRDDLNFIKKSLMAGSLYHYDAIIFIIDTIARYLFVDAVNLVDDEKESRHE